MIGGEKRERKREGERKRISGGMGIFNSQKARIL